MDTLSRLLILNILEGAIDKNCLLGDSWKIHHTTGEFSVVRWHTVTQGAAKIETPTGQTFTLRPGRIVLLPHNSAHCLNQLEDEPTHIICGSLRLQYSARHFLTTLPEVLYLAPSNNSLEFYWLKEVICFLQQESDTGMLGSDALCSQQCSTLFTLAIRNWLTQVTTEKNLLNLLLHPRLGLVISQMIENPSHPWTIKELAQQSYMSRASFAQLFSKISNTTPMSVLTMLRLQIAAQTLSRETLPIVVIAESVGYANESSFHKAFVREFNCTPGEYRKKIKLLGTE